MARLIHTTYVPDEGPDNARILLVGEAPGECEEGNCSCSSSTHQAGPAPFIGKSGQFLERYLGRCGVDRGEVYLANLCHYRPKDNKFIHLLKSDELSEGLLQLDETIRRVNPNIIIALGNWPMYYLTGNTSTKKVPGTGIMSWRGSLVPGVGTYVPSAEGRKVLITFHPAFVVRAEGFGFHPIFKLDLMKAVRHSSSPTLTYPTYEGYIDPINIWTLAEEMVASEWLSVDIETFGNSLACVGFADSPERGLCITYENPHGFEVAEWMLQQKTKKIYQYGTFDVNYLKHFYNMRAENFAFDTYIAAANLMPEFSKGLAFLTSIYTDFPYYKEDRKVWKQTGSMKTLWEYNIKDCIATYMIAMEQMKELNDLYRGM